MASSVKPCRENIKYTLLVQLGWMGQLFEYYCLGLLCVDLGQSLAFEFYICILNFICLLDDLVTVLR